MSEFYSLEYALRNIPAIDSRAATLAQKRLDGIIKPLGSLGKLEDHIVKIAALTGSGAIDLSRKAVVVFCADNGIVARAVTQSPQEVTAIVARNLVLGETCVCAMAKIAGADIIPVDIGIASDVDTPGILRRKIAYGTKDFSREPAMTPEQAVQAIEAGIGVAGELKKLGYRMLATGEMGIGNTTTSSAMAAVLMNKPVETVTGRGAGLSSEGLKRKIKLIRETLERHRPDPEDPLDVLAKVGGFDIAGMAGLCIGGALYGIPVVLDGFISTVAAMVACGLNPEVRNALLPSHVSAEPAGRMAMDFLELSPLLEAGMRLGEGTGAVATFPLYDMALECYNNSASFEDKDMEPYGQLV